MVDGSDGATAIACESVCRPLWLLVKTVPPVIEKAKVAVVPVPPI